eukprot:CAMPEP_0118918330 /NCGR_PEP_ID=MMETSP1166-20130328/17852_1 /TAXON_ID=1104430 /ORGANISM="Chrysoreinhardia sp, Strain CCMP3193" /LENGTH=30 /DNA_ID= /DNA_START= /DNA_END= /DNA_ORIENTATION=
MDAPSQPAQSNDDTVSAKLRSFIPAARGAS